VDVECPDETSSAPKIAWGDTFFIFDPERNLEPKFRFPFATIVTKDYGDFDRASNLDRPGIFRLNIGVSKDTYCSLFGPPPSPSGGAGVVDTGHDFTVLDQIMPHPVYAPQRQLSRQCARCWPRLTIWRLNGVRKLRQVGRERHGGALRRGHED
jgi:hypothetical protein